MATEEKLNRRQNYSRLGGLMSFLLLIGGAMGAVIGFSAGGAIRATWASLVLGSIAITDLELTQSESAHKLRRSLQKHYLSYDLYIPLDDIVVVNDQDLNQARLTFLMRNGCGDAKLYIWVPLKVRLPFYGARVWEWCWKPQLKNQAALDKAANEPPSGSGLNPIPPRPREFTKQLSPPPSSTNNSRKS